jgi:hypothetical protein
VDDDLALIKVTRSGEYAPASWSVRLSIGPVKPSCLVSSMAASALVTADGRKSEQVKSLDWCVSASQSRTNYVAGGKSDLIGC